MKTRLLLGAAALAISCADVPEYVISEVQPIVNGELAAPGDFNAVGLLFFGNSLCTGTLIDTSNIPGAGPEDVGTWVVTASHCTIESQAISTTFNIGNGTTPFSLSNFSQRIQAKKLFTHPKFISQGGLPQFFLGNDIALVQLEEPVDLDGTNIIPVPMNRTRLEDVTQPSTSLQQRDCDISKNCFTVVGFGDTVGGAGDAGAKRFVNVVLEGLDSEHINFGNFNHGGDGPNGNGSGNTCQGDSGGPSFMEIDGVFSLIAVTSGGAGGCIGDSFSQRTDSDTEEFLDAVIGGGIIPVPAGCESDGICQLACGISDRDCNCARDGFCQSPANCPGAVPFDPDCSNGNNTEETGCTVAPSAPSSSSPVPVGIVAGLFTLLAFFGLRRRNS